MKNIFLVLILAVVLGAVYIWTSDVLNIWTPDVLILNGQEIKIEIADTPAKRARGLSGRESLAEGAGMLFIFPKPARQNFWMKDMKFPIDIIWIRQTTDGDRVVGFVENALPPASGQLENSLAIYSSPENVDRVLEINAGLVKKWRIKVGDIVQ